MPTTATRSEPNPAPPSLLTFAYSMWDVAASIGRH